MSLVRPTFTDDTCGDARRPGCGSGCCCGNTNASNCVGCACKFDNISNGYGCNSFYCDSTLSPLPRGVPCPSSVPAGFTCYRDGPTFATAVNAQIVTSSFKLALMCSADTPCIIDSTQLIIACTVMMENVLIQNTEKPFRGLDGLMHIKSGSVTGTNISFHNGTTGCVYSTAGLPLPSWTPWPTQRPPAGTFSCTDCVFDKCSASVRVATLSPATLATHQATTYALRHAITVGRWRGVHQWGCPELGAPDLHEQHLRSKSKKGQRKRQRESKMRFGVLLPRHQREQLRGLHLQARQHR